MRPCTRPQGVRSCSRSGASIQQESLSPEPTYLSGPNFRLANARNVSGPKCLPRHNNEFRRKLNGSWRRRAQPNSYLATRRSSPEAPCAATPHAAAIRRGHGDGRDAARTPDMFYLFIGREFNSVEHDGKSLVVLHERDDSDALAGYRARGAAGDTTDHNYCSDELHSYGEWIIRLE